MSTEIPTRVRVVGRERGRGERPVSSERVKPRTVELAALTDLGRSADDLRAVAVAAADATGGAVAIVLSGYGAVLVAGNAEHRLSDAQSYVDAKVDMQAGARPPDLVAEAPIMRGRDEVGAVLLLDDGRPMADGARSVLHLTAAAALGAVFDAEGAERATSPGGRAARAMLDELCAGVIDGQALAQRAYLIGCDLSAGAVALRASTARERALRTVNAIHDHVGGALITSDGGEISALLCGGAARAADSVERVVAGLKAHAMVAFSVHEPSLAHLRRALREAEIALGLVCAGDATAGEAATGTWPLLVRLAASDPNALRQAIATTIGPALAHDSSQGTELVPTLRAYLACGANMNATAAAMPAHRHTIASRLQRLREVTGLDPLHAGEDRELLGVGLKAERVLAALAPTSRATARPRQPRSRRREVEGQAE